MGKKKEFNELGLCPFTDSNVNMLLTWHNSSHLLRACHFPLPFIQRQTKAGPEDAHCTAQPRTASLLFFPLSLSVTCFALPCVSLRETQLYFLLLRRPRGQGAVLQSILFGISVAITASSRPVRDY